MEEGNAESTEERDLIWQEIANSQNRRAKPQLVSHAEDGASSLVQQIGE